MINKKALGVRHQASTSSSEDPSKIKQQNNLALSAGKPQVNSDISLKQ